MKHKYYDATCVTYFYSRVNFLKLFFLIFCILYYIVDYTSLFCGCRSIERTTLNYYIPSIIFLVCLGTFSKICFASFHMTPDNFDPNTYHSSNTPFKIITTQNLQCLKIHQTTIQFTQIYHLNLNQSFFPKNITPNNT